MSNTKIPPLIAPAITGLRARIREAERHTPGGQAHRKRDRRPHSQRG